MLRISALPFLLLVIPLAMALSAEDRDRLVRATEARTPEEEQKGFRLPQGFSIQLFADEALLGGKPINMAFDARGRLWVSSTREYPFAVPKDRWSDPQGTRAKGSKDSVRILEDTDGDGSADKVTVFADELNLPTGVLPYKNGCIAWSIPNIWYFEDTDGDGKCDKRRILFGPLGYERDTHGMISSLRLGLDGWVYATHGFSNTSHFEVRPENQKPETRNQKPDTLDITSGSVFRFRPDGSRIELWTSGQVNPFGLCWDSWGNLYSADCHSNPITQLIRGAEYPQFGKPAGPLGFGPVMCDHAHGSTGLCGIVYIDGGVWGPEWDDHMFVGNCVTSRVNHDSVTFTGSTPKANEAPDFLTSDDPWFRPVDLQLGPDSALYVADFYNRIIGHYEVPLDHPGRDRERGRIWRVVREGYTGKLTECDLSKAIVGELVDAMGSANIGRRSLAVAEAAARPRASTIQSLQNASVSGALTLRQRSHASWALYQVASAQHLFDPLAKMATDCFETARDDHRGEAATALSFVWNVLAELPEWPDEDYERFASTFGEGLEGLSGERVQCAAVRAYVRRPSLDEYVLTQLTGPLDDHWAIPVGPDATLRYMMHLALREVMHTPKGFAALGSARQGIQVAEELAQVAVSVPSEESAIHVFDFLQRGGGASTKKVDYISHVARHLPPEREGELVAFARKQFGDELDVQLVVFDAIREGRGRQMLKTSQPLAAWSTDLSARLLSALQSEPAGTWTAITPPTDANPNPWRPQSRKCSDGGHRTLLDSHVIPGTEKLTGTLRSAPFALPEKLTFWLAGHRGFPAATAHEKNFVRLVDTETGEELSRAYPPRNDTAQQVSWAFPPSQANPKSEIGDLKSKLVRLELVDGDTASAYAWLAAGGFEPAVVTIPDDPLRRDKRVRYLAEWNSAPSASADAVAWLTKLPDKAGFTPETRQALAEFLAERSPDPIASLLVPLARDAELAPAVFGALHSRSDSGEELAKAFRMLPFRTQAKLGAALAGSVAGATRLFQIAAPAVVAEPLVSSKLTALNDAGTTKRLKELTASLPPQNEALNKLIAQRLKSYDPSKADAKRGEEIFTTVCFICHRIGVRGNLVGPQLDGIGARGAERLLEDILDPNRAVDPAFRLHMVKRKDGTLYAGLQRREEGEGIVFTDATAQETRIPKADIASNEESPLSLMPPGLGEVLSEQQLHDLMAYLLARK